MVIPTQNKKRRLSALISGSNKFRVNSVNKRALKNPAS
jgi:hypothetical protein